MNVSVLTIAYCLKRGKKSALYEARIEFDIKAIMLL